MIEGTVKETKGNNAAGRFQKIRITKTDGTETELLLGKEIRVQAGMAYRFYFSRQETALSGIKTLDAALNLGSFYGLEKSRGWEVRGVVRLHAALIVRTARKYLEKERVNMANTVNGTVKWFSAGGDTVSSVMRKA